MSESEDFPVQPAEETEALTDPSYLTWSAALEAETDYSLGISAREGLAKLAERGATPAEVSAYARSYNAEGLRALTRDALGGRTFRNPYTATTPAGNQVEEIV